MQLITHPRPLFLTLSLSHALSPPRFSLTHTLFRARTGTLSLFFALSRSLVHRARLISPVLPLFLCSSLSPPPLSTPLILNLSFSLSSLFTLTLFSPLLPARGVLSRNILPHRTGSLSLFHFLCNSLQHILSPLRACVRSHSCSRSLLHRVHFISHLLRVLLCLSRSSLSPSPHHFPRIFPFSLYPIFTLTLCSPLLPARGVLCRNILPRRVGG